jgi:hypothetical protein
MHVALDQISAYGSRRRVGVRSLLRKPGGWRGGGRNVGVGCGPLNNVCDEPCSRVEREKREQCEKETGDSVARVVSDGVG